MRRRATRSLKLRLGLAVVLVFVLLAAGADLIARQGPLEQNYARSLEPPSLRAPLGMDTLGRDNLARLAHGARVSLLVAVGAVILTVALGVPLGALAGYFGGIIDVIIMRTADVFLAFPFVLGAIALMTSFGPGAQNIFIALAVLGWPQIARITRAQVIDEAAKDYVAAVRVVGGSPLYIFRRHLLPGAAGPIAVFSLMGVGANILTEATLSFLGIGVQLPQPAWGSMLAEAMGRLGAAPWLLLGPGAAIVLATLGFNLIGEGISDQFEPDRP